MMMKLINEWNWVPFTMMMYIRTIQGNLLDKEECEKSSAKYYISADLSGGKANGGEIVNVKAK